MLEGSYVGLVGCEDCGTVRMGCVGPCGVCKSWKMVFLNAEAIHSPTRIVTMYKIENMPRGTTHPEDLKDFT